MATARNFNQTIKAGGRGLEALAEFSRNLQKLKFIYSVGAEGIWPIYHGPLHGHRWSGWFNGWCDG